MRKYVYYIHKIILINKVTYNNAFIMFYGDTTDVILDL